MCFLFRRAFRFEYVALVSAALPPTVPLTPLVVFPSASGRGWAPRRTGSHPIQINPLSTRLVFAGFSYPLFHEPGTPIVLFFFSPNTHVLNVGPLQQHAFPMSPWWNGSLSASG